MLRTLDVPIEDQPSRRLVLMLATALDARERFNNVYPHTEDVIYDPEWTACVEREAFKRYGEDPIAFEEDAWRLPEMQRMERFRRAMAYIKADHERKALLGAVEEKKSNNNKKGRL